MMTPHNRSTLPFVIGVVVIATLLCISAVRSYHSMQLALPPTDTITLAQAKASHHLLPILGTGSMRPLIPAGHSDEVVAYARPDYCAFAVLGTGDLVVFKHQSGRFVLHQLAQLTSEGWITSGSDNSAYDTSRVTAANFICRVDKVYLLQ